MEYLKAAIFSINSVFSPSSEVPTPVISIFFCFLTSGFSSIACPLHYRLAKLPLAVLMCRSNRLLIKPNNNNSSSSSNLSSHHRLMGSPCRPLALEPIIIPQWLLRTLHSRGLVLLPLATTSLSTIHHHLPSHRHQRRMATVSRVPSLAPLLHPRPPFLPHLHHLPSNSSILPPLRV